MYKDWLTHIFVHLVVLVCFSGIVSLGTQLSSLAYSFGIDTYKSGMFLAFYGIAALFMTVPLCYGVLYFEMQCSDGNKPQPLDVFSAFSSVKKLLFSYELFVSLFVRILPCFMPAAAMWIYMDFYYVEGTYTPLLDLQGVDEIYFMQSTLLLLLVYLGIMLSVRYFVGVYVSIKRPEISKRDAFYIGSVCCHNNNMSIAGFFLSFVPLFVVSLFTAGILFVIYTVPYFVLSCMNMAKYLYEKEMQETATKNIVYNTQQGDAESF